MSSKAIFNDCAFIEKFIPQGAFTTMKREVNTPAKKSPAIISIFLLTTSLSHSSTIVADFDGGSDAEWTRYDPIGVLTGGAAVSTFGFPDGDKYRIQAVSSPNPALGPSRAGAFRPDGNFSNFRTTVDLVDWDNSLQQTMSLFARGREIGPGQTDGYIFSYLDITSEGVGFIQLNRVDNESIEIIDLVTSNAEILLDPANDYRLVFTGNGPVLTGQVFDLTDLGTPLATVTSTDATYPDGVTGLLSSAAGGTLDPTFSNEGTDVTFDNFTAAVPEPGSILLVALGGLGLLRRKRQR